MDQDILKRLQGHGNVPFKNRKDHNVYALSTYSPYFNPNKHFKAYKFATAVTDTSTTQISEVQGTMWLTEVAKFGEALRRADQAVVQKDFDKGTSVLTVPKSTSHLNVDTAKSSGEGDDRDITELTNIDTVSLTLSASSFLQGEVRISKEIALTSRVDLVEQARYTIAQAQAQDVDTAILGTTTTTGIFQNTSVTNVVLGGTATTVAGLGTGDVLTTDLFADAMEKIEVNNFVPQWFFLGTKQRKAYRKDSQFVNAAEYGSDDVISRGEIGNYLGVKVITTTNAPAYTSSDSDINDLANKYAVAGTTCAMAATNVTGAPAGGVLGWKERPSISYQYWPSFSAHRIYYDQTFATALLFAQGVCLVKVANA